MSDVKSRLAAALQGIVAAINDYLADAEESGCESYTLYRLVPIPFEEPEDYDPDGWDAEHVAWRIKVAVREAKKLYFQLYDKAELPRSGLTFWKRLLAYSRVHKDAAAIYTTADSFREWAKAEAAQFYIATAPSGGRPAYQRDHKWLEWRTNEGLTPARIRNRWDGLTDEERRAICPTCWETVGGSDADSQRAGLEVVENGLRKAKKEERS